MRGARWHARLRLDSGATKTETTKTAELEKAQQTAFAMWHSFSGEIRAGGAPRKKTFGPLAQDFLRYEKTQGRSKHMLYRWDMKIRVLTRHFGTKKPSQITKDAWTSYIVDRIDSGKGIRGGPLSRETLEAEMQTMSSILKYAHEKKLINYVPTLKLPKTAPKPASRPFLNGLELQQLLHTLEQRVADARGAEIRYARQMLLHYCAILAATGMRTNDALLLRWGDLDYEMTPSALRIITLYLRGKDQPRTSIALLDAIKWIDSWREICRATGPGDLVFSRGKNIPWNARERMKKALKQAGLLEDRFGRTRTPYSLRHSFAMAMLQHPECRVDVLAKVMGTSVKMIEKHYGSHATIVRDADLLHRIRTPDPLTDPETMAKLRIEANEYFAHQDEILVKLAEEPEADDDDEDEEPPVRADSALVAARSRFSLRRNQLALNKDAVKNA
ncbi:tyrosine-type recombinase/integrase [Skermanella sp. TT6]|nr:tyrosine-type recombinase/integrase [Skermanella sp. TT6]